MIEGDRETATMRCYLLGLTAGGGTGDWRFADRHIAIDPHVS